jgi:hypothetical protein
MAVVQLTRPPQTDDELHAVVEALWGVSIPRVQVCEGHVAPFTAFAHAYFSRPPNIALWYASRGSGKSYMLALLSLTKAFVQEMDVTLLGGSMAQSQNVHEHNARLLAAPNAPRHALLKDTATEISTMSNSSVRPLPASQKTVRGPHPNVTLLDEIDEMEYSIYSAAMGQAMPKKDRHGHEVNEYTVAASTWQNPIGTFTTVKREFEEKGLPVFTFCYRENLEPHGWMTADYVERKRASVPSEMFRVEFDLGEPTGDARAFDMSKIELYGEVRAPLEGQGRTTLEDTEVVYAEPVGNRIYAAGADWAKSQDYTVIVVVDITEEPRRVVYWRRMRRQPYPTMFGAFDSAMKRYHAVGYHDGTGLGNVVHDLLESDANKFVFVGRERTQMLLDYVTAFESGEYRIPRETPIFAEHKYCPNDAIYRRLEESAHLPDTVAAMALAHRAAEKIPQPAGDAGTTVSVPKDLVEWRNARQADKQFNLPPEERYMRVGDVMVVDEFDGDPLSNFWSV